MADDVEDTLCSVLRMTDFALQLDESTLPGNKSLLLAYVRFIKDESLVQELLFARLLDIHTKGESNSKPNIFCYSHTLTDPCSVPL
jgi:hypothetical protein